jgi:hypothetical protein
MLPLVFIIGCTVVYEDYNPRVGVKFHTSGTHYFKCCKCGGQTNLYKVRGKKVICSKCYHQDEKKYLYH